MPYIYRISTACKQSTRFSRTRLSHSNQKINPPMEHELQAFNHSELYLFIPLCHEEALRKENMLRPFGKIQKQNTPRQYFWCKSCVGFSVEIEGGEGGLGRLGGRMGSEERGVRHLSRCDS